MSLYSVSHRMVVDDIVSELGHDEHGNLSMHTNQMFTLKHTHATNCLVCNDAERLGPGWLGSYNFDPKRDPIVRFTSDGLQVSNCVSPDDVQSSVSASQYARGGDAQCVPGRTSTGSA